MAGRHKASTRRKRIPGHTPEAEFAAELNITYETLRKWRRLGKTSAYIVVGRQVHYVDDDKPRWLASLRVSPPRSAHTA
jgi:hypothetical protein